MLFEYYCVIIRVDDLQLASTSKRLSRW